MSIKAIIALIFVGVMFQGCLKSVKAYNNVPVRYQMESDGVAYAIKQASNKNRWSVKYIKPGYAQAEKRLSRNRKMIKVNIKYTNSYYSITYAESKGMKFNGSKIHSSYNTYVGKLKKTIDREMKIANNWYPKDEKIAYVGEKAPVATVALATPVIATTGFPYDFKKATKPQPDSFALVIGINKYQQNTNVEYADTSALAFAELAHVTFGLPKENIITMTNEQATSGQLKAKIELIRELADSRGNLYVYYAGHGVPGKNGDTYILPYDMSADTIHLEPNLKLDTIYAKLSNLPVKKVFIFMDSCFSGKDDDGGLLYRGVAPVLKTKKSVIRSNKLTLVTAGKSTDFANDFKSKQQRMFSYYLIQELSTGATSLNTVYPDLRSKVKRSSLRKGIGYKQEPQIYGNKTQRLY